MDKFGQTGVSKDLITGPMRTLFNTPEAAAQDTAGENDHRFALRHNGTRVHIFGRIIKAVDARHAQSIHAQFFKGKFFQFCAGQHFLPSKWRTQARPQAAPTRLGSKPSE